MKVLITRNAQVTPQAVQASFRGRSMSAFTSVIVTLRKDLIFILLFSVSVICFIEFWLVEYPASYAFQYHFGQLALKLSYAYVSAFIFYFLVVHIPRERRRQKSNMAIKFKIMKIEIEISTLIGQVYRDAEKKISAEMYTKEEIYDACSRVSSYAPVNSIMDSHIPFPDWFEFLTFKSEKIRATIYDLIALGEGVDSELIEPLADIDKWVSMYMSYNRDKLGNETLIFLTDALFGVRAAFEKLSQLYKLKYAIYDKKRRPK